MVQLTGITSDVIVNIRGKKYHPVLTKTKFCENDLVLDRKDGAWNKITMKHKKKYAVSDGVATEVGINGKRLIKLMPIVKKHKLFSNEKNL